MLKTTRRTCFSSAFQDRFRSALISASLAVALSASAQELIYQEGFNNDGSTNIPPRYTFVGRDVFEVSRIQAELNNYDQKGPIYWAHNFNTSYVGNPEIPARRMIWTWRAAADTSTATEAMLKLWESSVAWLLNGKANARIVVNPDVASIGGLADRLTALGHTVESDDITTFPDEQDVAADLMIHGPGANNASRFILVPKPVIAMNSPDYDDMLLGSIGSTVTFTPGRATVTASGHPAAGGTTGTFDAFTGDQQFELVGTILPPGATTLATVTRVISPTIANLGDVDAMIAGTKVHEEGTGTVTALDFGDASPGSWGNDQAIPGGYTGNWAIRAQGTINVATAGTYRFALGSDDGARLQIDVDKNGITAADLVLEDAGPHAHQAVYTNVTFPAAGTYPFEVRSYNSGGGGSLEVSVAVQAGDIPDDALDSGYWELLGVEGAVSPVTVQGTVNVTGYKATGPDVEVPTPIAVLYNGPTETPAGRFYDGGPFTGFEGTGFIGASGLNKWAYPDGLGYRSLTMKPVSVAGKTNVKVTVALAATVVDFETSDYIQIYAHPNGAASAGVLLADFAGVQNAVQPWLADKMENNVRRLTKQFADFTYNVPAGATDLVLEFRVATTWWTEIAAFDNVRITAGAASTPLGMVSAAASGTGLVLNWTGGTGPFLVQGKLALGDPWIDLKTTSDRTATIPMAGLAGFFRVVDGTSKTVRLFKASLNGANERPTPNASPATGTGLLALDGLTATYVVSYQNLTGVPSLYHVHGLGGPDVAVGVKFNLVPVGTLSATGGLFVGQSTVDQATADGIIAGQTYFNIHTPANPGGEIRGQIVP